MFPRESTPSQRNRGVQLNRNASRLRNTAIGSIGLMLVLSVMLSSCAVHRSPVQRDLPAEQDVSVATPQTINLAGTWEYEEDSLVYLVRLDNRGNGTYDWQDGKIVTSTFSHDRWAGTWQQRPKTIGKEDSNYASPRTSNLLKAAGGTCESVMITPRLSLVGRFTSLDSTRLNLLNSLNNQHFQLVGSSPFSCD